MAELPTTDIENYENTLLNKPITAAERFSGAALHEWMPFVIFRVRSRERPQRHYQADFWVDVASRRVQQWKLNL